MGIPVEKNQSNLAKPEAFSKTGLLQSDKKNGSPLFEEVNETNPDDILSEALNPKFRVRIFIKASPGDNGEFFEQKQNDVKDFFPDISTLRKMIFRDVSADNDVGVKEVEPVKQIDKSNNRSPFETLFNTFKSIQEPIRPSISNIPDDTKSEPSNFIQAVKQDKTPARTEKHNVEGPIEDFMDTLDNIVSNIMPHVAPNRMKYESQESGEADLSLRPRDFLDQADNLVGNIISNMIGNVNSNGNLRPTTPRVFMQPHIVRIIKFGNPHFLQMGSFPPIMNQKTPNNVRFLFSPNKNILQFSPQPVEDKSSSSEENNKLDDRRPVSHPTTYKIEPTLSSEQSSTNNYSEIPVTTAEKKVVSGEKIKETTEIPLKDNTNKIETLTYKSKQSPIIDRINTDNIEPFANFVEKYTS